MANKTIPLFHGSASTIETPQLGQGKKNNDYGQGFYCTKNRGLACEWASRIQGQNGFVNEYTLDMTGLKVLDLSKYSILHWITMLLNNRTFTLTSPISIQAKAYLIENFSIDLSGYDIVQGYRADDSYFSFAEDFLNNTISVRLLSKAMRLGKLGVQHVLISQKAFDSLTFVQAEAVQNTEFYPLYAARDIKARATYKNDKSKLVIDPNELYVLDILRGGVNDGDPRL